MTDVGWAERNGDEASLGWLIQYVSYAYLMLKFSDTPYNTDTTIMK